MDIRKKILLVDDSKVILTVLKKYFLDKGYNTFSAISALEAAEILKEHKIPVAIIDINMPNISGIDLLLWIRKYSPDTHIITMSASISQEMKDFILRNGGVNFEKKADYNALNEMVNQQFLDKTTVANISEITLYELIQVVLMSGKSKIFDLFYDKSNKFGEIFFRDGRIIHAQCYNYTGEEAMYQMMKISGGYFQEHTWYPPETDTISLNFELLFMRIAQKIDELKFSNTISGFTDSKIHKRILVVEEDEKIITKINEILDSEKYMITYARSLQEFTDFIKSLNFDVVYCGLKFSQQDALELLAWVKDNNPNLKFVFMDQDAQDYKILSEEYGRSLFINKDHDIETIDEYTREITQKVYFSGKATDINLFDYIQIISLSRRNVVVDIKSNQSDNTAKVYLKDGTIVNANFNDLEGENALVEISELKSIVFSDSEYINPIKTTMKDNIANIILKTFSKKDSFQQSFDLSTIDSGLTANYQILDDALKQKDKIKETEKIKRLESNNFTILIGKSTVSDLMNCFENIPYSSIDNTINYESLGISIKLDKNKLVKELSFFNSQSNKNLIIST